MTGREFRDLRIPVQTSAHVVVDFSESQVSDFGTELIRTSDHRDELVVWDHAGESSTPRTVIVVCLLSSSSVPEGDATLVTTHVRPLRSNVSPGLKTNAVYQSSVATLFGKKMVSLRGTLPALSAHPGAMAQVRVTAEAGS